MKIVIVGAGVVGEALCSELSEINNDVILIEKEEDILNKVIEKNDITGLAGNGASYENLLEAGVDSADIFIAVTEADELNIISCIMAKKLGAKYTIARVRNPEYTTNMRFVREELGISMMINPEEEAAKTIMNTLKFPNAESVDTFFSNRANMLELLIEKNSQLVGFQLKNLESHLKEKVIICIVERENNIIIPTGDFILAENDTIYVTGTNDAVANFYDKMGYKKSKDINSVMLIGGGTLSHYLLKRLIKEKKQVKVIEKEREIAICKEKKAVDPNTYMVLFSYGEADKPYQAAVQVYLYMNADQDTIVLRRGATIAIDEIPNIPDYIPPRGYLAEICTLRRVKKK